MADKKFTVIATCPVCKKEVNRANNILEEDKFRLILAAPLNCKCEKKHMTFSDCFSNVVVTFEEN